MNKLIGIVLILSSLILVSSFASAQIIVAGKIYNSDFTQAESGAIVTATCSGASDSTSTIGDGSYGFYFDETMCSNETSIQVKAVKGSDNAESALVVVNTLSLGDKEVFYIIANLGLNAPEQPAPVVTRGRGTRLGLLTVNITEPTFESPNETEEIPEEIPVEETEEEQPTGLARITGAVIGTLGTTGTWIVVLFIVGIVAASVAVRIRSKAKKD